MVSMFITLHINFIKCQWFKMLYDFKHFRSQIFFAFYGHWIINFCPRHAVVYMLDYWNTVIDNSYWSWMKFCILFYSFFLSACRIKRSRVKVWWILVHAVRGINTSLNQLLRLIQTWPRVWPCPFWLLLKIVQIYF
jgi:hypothetical protein